MVFRPEDLFFRRSPQNSSKMVAYRTEELFFLRSSWERKHCPPSIAHAPPKNCGLATCLVWSISSCKVSFYNVIKYLWKHNNSRILSKASLKWRHNIDIARNNMRTCVKRRTCVYGRPYVVPNGRGTWLITPYVCAICCMRRTARSFSVSASLTTRLDEAPYKQCYCLWNKSL